MSGAVRGHQPHLRQRSVLGLTEIDQSRTNPGVGVTCVTGRRSRCRIGHLPFPVHSRRLRWTLSGLRPGRAAYLAGLTTMPRLLLARAAGGRLLAETWLASDLAL